MTLPLQPAFRKLLEHFGPQHWWPARTRLEMMLGAILTQNTAWTNVEKAISNLRSADALKLTARVRWRAIRARSAGTLSCTSCVGSEQANVGLLRGYFRPCQSLASCSLPWFPSLLYNNRPSDQGPVFKHRS